MTEEQIRKNVETVKAEIARAAREAGRDPAEILLVAATKMNDADSVRAAIRAGVDVCGENPDFDSSLPMLTSSSTSCVSPRFSAVLEISCSSGRLSTEWIRAQSPTTCRTLFFCRWPIKCSGDPS